MFFIYDKCNRTGSADPAIYKAHDLNEINSRDIAKILCCLDLREVSDRFETNAASGSADGSYF